MSGKKKQISSRFNGTQKLSVLVLEKYLKGMIEHYERMDGNTCKTEKACVFERIQFMQKDIIQLKGK